MDAPLRSLTNASAEMPERGPTGQLSPAGLPPRGVSAVASTATVTPAQRPVGPHPLRRPTSHAMQSLVVRQCQDEEEAAEVAALRVGASGASGRSNIEDQALGGASGTRDERGVTPPGASSGSGAPVRGGHIEPAFAFVVVPTADELKDLSDSFVSPYMMEVTSTWPQPVTSRLRKRMNSIGKESAGARKGALRGSNATMKTWSSRIRTACAFANFVGRTVCINQAKPRPDDAEIDRGVRKFFQCLTPYTKLVITTFLECRRRGYAVSGGGRRLSATSLKDYTSGLAFLFAEAKVHGTRGTVSVVPDCCERTSPWQPKGVAELQEERKFRADPGTYTGNPMATADGRDFRRATNKEARQGGETQLSSAPVTEAMMERWFGVFIAQHLPATNESGASVSMVSALKAMVASAVIGMSGAASEGVDGANKSIPKTATPAAEPGKSQEDQPASDDDCDSPSFTPPSNALSDILVYIFYVFAFITVARPITLINLKWKDISWPDMNVAENQEFFNRCASRPHALRVCLWYLLMLLVSFSGCFSSVVGEGKRDTT